MNNLHAIIATVYHRRQCLVHVKFAKRNVVCFIFSDRLEASLPVFT